MSKYRKKPIVIEAFQLNERGLVGEEQKKILAFQYSRYDDALSKTPREEAERINNGEL